MSTRMTEPAADNSLEFSPGRRPTLVQICLMVLPIGTVVLGTIAMIWYFQRDYVVGKQNRDGLYTKEPAAASIADYTTKLSSTLTTGRSPSSEPGKLGLVATMSLIEGAIGETNMGYQPASQEFEADGFVWKNIWVDNTGKRNPTEIIEVRVHYALPGDQNFAARDSLPIAVVLELANAFTGTQTRRTVRFLFLGGQCPASGESPGGEAYARLMEDRRIKVMGVLDLNGSDFDPGRYLGLDGKIDAPALMDTVQDLHETISRMANQ